MKCSEIIKILETLSPRSMACDWDNPGLLAGRSGKEVKTIFLAVDATDSVIEQAEQAGADMILTHHPLIFKGIKQVSDQNFIGRRVLRMIQDDISYYAMHTNFDAAPGCMADLAAKKLGLTDCEVLEKMGETGDGHFLRNRMHWTLRTADDAAGSCRAGQGGIWSAVCGGSSVSWTVRQ